MARPLRHPRHVLVKLSDDTQAALKAEADRRYLPLATFVRTLLCKVVDDGFKQP